MDKAPDAFRTISEVSEWLDTPTYVLRFWESRFPQIKPVKRAGGRRYYRPDDMMLLGGIKKLLHFENNTIKGVQRIIKNQGIKRVADMSPDLNEKVVSPVNAGQGGHGAGVDSMVVLKEDAPVAQSAAAESEKPDPLKLTPDDKTAKAEPVSVKVVKKTRIIRPKEEPLVAAETEQTEIETPVEAGPLKEAQQLEEAAAYIPDSTMLPGPFAISPPRTYKAEDLQEIETLYYSLKMVRNNMRRVAKRG